MLARRASAENRLSDQSEQGAASGCRSILEEKSRGSVRSDRTAPLI